MDLSKLRGLTNSPGDANQTNDLTAGPAADQQTLNIGPPLVGPGAGGPDAADAGQRRMMGSPVPMNYSSPVNRPDFGIELWFNGIIGLILLYVSRQFGAFLISKLFGRPFHTQIWWQEGSPLAGQEVSYPDLQGYTMLSESGVFSFGVIVLMEALLKGIYASGRHVPRGVTLGIMVLAILATLLNLYIVLFLMSHDQGLPLISALAVAFGGYIVMDIYRILKATCGHSRDSITSSTPST